MTKPTRQEVTAWIRELGCDSDKAIREAAALVAALRSEYATPAQLSRARALARELIFTSCSSSRAFRECRADDDARLSRAITYAVDPGGAFYNAFRECIRTMRARCDEDRAAYLADLGGRSPVLDTRSSLERAYDAELRLCRTMAGR